jgi:hypothetical protein
MPKHCIADSLDTRIPSDPDQFVSRVDASEQDVEHDGWCGPRSIALGLAVHGIVIDHRAVSKSLHLFAMKNKENPLCTASATARWEYMFHQADGGAGVDRRGWINAIEDCK